jgi:ubiquinone/menaquinone biosynthesis C-methylase UbiE
MLEGLRANKNNLIAHDLTKGIPCPDNSVDAVYHSHFLAHLDRNLADPAQDAALIFLKECRRVLKPGGVMRSVVPDLEYFARAYLAHLELAAAHPDECAQHEKYVSDIIEMAARKKPFAASMQRPIMRRIESLLLGDARKRGETQQWWYDRINLKVLLESAGFHSIREFDYRTSSIADWSQFGFDQNADGTPYQRHSLFLEAVK